MCSVWCSNFFGSGLKTALLNTALADAGGASEAQCADPSSLSSKAMTLTYVPAAGNFTNAGTYVDGSGAPQLRVHCLKKGSFDMHDPVTVIRDGAGGKVLAAVRASTGMTEDVFHLYRAAPSYEGQEPLEGAAHAFAGYDLAQVGLGERCFLWAQVDTQRGLSAARNAFRLVQQGGALSEQPLYRGEKFSAMSFYAQVTAGGEGGEGGAGASTEGAAAAAAAAVVVAKAQTGPGKCNNNPVIEVAAGVDLVAVVCCCSFLVGSGGSAAGGLAGAGVV